jgi:ABC-2 type transport system permease protein
MHGFTAVFRKELTQMIRDRTTLMFALAVPVFELMLFGLIDMNAKNIPAVVFDQSRSQESRRLVEQFEATHYIRVIERVASVRSMQHAIIGGHAQVGIEIPPDYARDLAHGRQAFVRILIDGSDSTVASQALTAANGVVLQEGVRQLMQRSRRALPVEARPLIMFNPDMRSANLLIPGLIAILLTFSGTVLSAFAIVKERERGTLEQLMVTPVSPLAVVLGKILPYLGVAYSTLHIVLMLMTFVFRVPFNGSVTLLLALSSIYLLALLSFGLLISSRAQSQMEAMQQAMGVMLPSVLLSGYIFPIASLPLPLRFISYVLPATHFLRIARGIVIRGATFGDLWEPVLSLLALSAVLIAASTRAFKKTVK